MKKWIWALCFLSPFAVAKPTFEEYVAQLKDEAVSKGYEAEFVSNAFEGIEFYQRSVKADKNQPEFKMTLDRYLKSRVPDWKVQKAVKLYQENKPLLDKIEAEYGVQGRFVVALWGNESNFGQFMGKFPVLSSLATLAYEGRREALFKKQLFAALEILHQGHIDKAHFVGSWAGAMGQSQFMPTSFLAYAQDFDGDGKKDIWGNKQDVFASIANYLKTEGWNNQLTWGRQVQIPEGFDIKLAGLEKDKMRNLSEWQALGVRRYDGSDLPANEIKASLIMPDDEKGRIYLVYENYHTLMHWNRSTYFGTAVGYMSDRIRKGG